MAEFPCCDDGPDAPGAGPRHVYWDIIEEEKKRILASLQLNSWRLSLKMVGNQIASDLEANRLQRCAAPMHACIWDTNLLWRDYRPAAIVLGGSKDSIECIVCLLSRLQQVTPFVTVALKQLGLAGSEYKCRSGDCGGKLISP